MKKPLILLVDDDAAVLESLEASLSPAFVEIARVEAFTEPGEVLGRLPRWAEEERSIAVAIVDQKMPGMTGVELIRRLRDWPGVNAPPHAAAGGSEGKEQFLPAAWMRAVLLTGYAGLDSALAAKNEAQVDRYLEKPWKPDSLRCIVLHQLRSTCRDSGLLRYFRQIVAESPEMLVAAFRLRYSVYRSTPPLDTVLHPNADEADLDGYDRRSIILVLLLGDGEKEHLVGTMRLVLRATSPQLEIIERAAKLMPSAKPGLQSSTDGPFPFLKLFPDRPILETFISKLEANSAMITEPSRHAIVPEARAGNTDRRQLEGTAAFCVANGIDHAVAGIPPLHRRHYISLGFEEVPGVERIGPPFPGMAVWTSFVRIRDSVKPHVDAMVARLGHTSDWAHGGLCFCKSFPACVSAPYVTGQFHEIDLFCPRRFESSATYIQGSLG